MGNYKYSKLMLQRCFHDTNSKLQKTLGYLIYSFLKVGFRKFEVTYNCLFYVVSFIISKSIRNTVVL